MRRRNGFCAVLLSAAALAMPFGAVSCPASENAPETEIETETEALTEEVFDKEKVMFVLDTLRVHEGPGNEDDTIAFSDQGDSVSAIGRIGDWYHVRLDSPYVDEAQTEAASDQPEAETETEAPAKEGYIFASLLTEDKEEMEQAVASNEAQKKINEAAAAAAAQAASSGGGRTVVSTQKIPDCDGGGGTIITRYSDGTTSTSTY